MAYLYRNGTNYHVQIFAGGRRRRFSLKTDNYGIARDKVRKLEAELINGDLERPTRTPTGEILSRFAQYLANQARPGSSSVQTDLYRLREFFGPVCPELEHNPRVRNTVHRKGGRSRQTASRRYQFSVPVNHVEEVTTQMIADFLIRMGTTRGLAPKTYNEYREIIHRFYNWAIKTNGVRMLRNPRSNPCEVVPKQKVPSPEIRFLKLSQIEKQLQALDAEPQLRTMVAVYIYAGLRREEALWLTPDDVDLQRGVIHVRAKTVAGEAWWPKTRQNRAVPISRALAAHLNAFVPSAGDVWFFPSPRGRRWNCDNFSHRLVGANKKKGLPWSCLDYRHTFGSHLAMKGESLYKIAVLMGNSPDICRRHYACLLPESLVGCVEFDQPENPSPVAADALPCA